VAAVQDFPRPETVKELQAFLGMVNFYRRFLPAIARTLKPLTDSLRGGLHASDPVQWPPECAEAFAASKHALLHATCLAHPTAGAQLSLAVDASATHVGATLQQQLPGHSMFQPLGFFSKKLEPAQQKYSAFDRELFAVYAGIWHFRHMLEGRKFAVLTDHKPLTHAVSRVSDPWTAQQCRHLAYVAEYTSDIRHIPGLSNIVADTLSRPPGHVPRVARGQAPSPSFPAGGLSAGNSQRATSSPSRPGPQSPASSSGQEPATPHVQPVLAPLVPATPTLPVNLAAMASRQELCPSVQRLRASDALRLQSVRVQGAQLLCDVSRGVPGPVVLLQDRLGVFQVLHGLAHPRIRATRRLVSARFVWHGLARDVGAWCRDCQTCQRGKVTKQPAAPLHSFPTATRHFLHVHVDLVGPLPTSAEGYVYLLTVIDRATRWFEAVPLKNMEADTVAEQFVTCWVARFGVPATVTSDQGPQFTSATWSGLCRQLGTQYILTTAYHPQANGMVERVHRQLKDALRARGAGAAWHSHLPWILLGLRAAPKEGSGISAAEMAEMVLGVPVQLPGGLLATPEAARDHPATLFQCAPSYAQVVDSPPAHLAAAPFVYIRRGGCGPPLTPLYMGPYEVLSKHAKTFTLKVGDKTEVVSVDRLKPHTGTSPVVGCSSSSSGAGQTCCQFKGPVCDFVSRRLGVAPVETRMNVVFTIVWSV
jgi:transposase InsO family protein